MSDWREGDLIEAEKKEIASSTRFRGVVYDQGGHLVLRAQGYDPSMYWLEQMGFAIKVLEAAPEPLPTERGAYLDKYGHDVWTITGFHGLRCTSNTSSDPAKYAPFTRLRPEPEVAAEVINQIANVWEFGPPETVAAWMREVGEKFGVTS